MPRPLSHPFVRLMARVAALVMLCNSARADASPPGLDSLSARWSRWMDRVGAPGMAVVMVRDTGVVAELTLGQRDVARGLPVTPSTRFYIASCTKPFVATAVRLRAHEGRLDASAPVRRFLPEFRIADAGLSDSLTIEDLIAHRPGLTSGPISLLQAHTGQLDEARFRRHLAAVRSPRRFEYSNVHYYLLGRVLERVTGLTWQQELERRLFQPAGMTRTTCSARSMWADSNVALPYHRHLGATVEAQVRKSDRTMHAAGGVASTPRDLGRWLRLELGAGALTGRQIFPRAAFLAMRQPLVAVPDRHPLVPVEQRIAWGGWDMRTYRGDTLFAHNGRFTGSAAMVGFLPSRGVGVAVLTNGSGPSLFMVEAVAADALDLLLGHAPADPTEGLLRLAARAARGDTLVRATGRLLGPVRDYAGRYESPDWGTFIVGAEGDSLAMRLGELAMPSVLTGEDRFLADGDTRGRFERDARGRVRAVWLELADSVRFVRR